MASLCGFDRMRCVRSDSIIWSLVSIVKLVYTRHVKTAGLAWAGCFMLLLLFHLLVLAPQEKLRIQTETLFTQTQLKAQAATEAARHENQIKLLELVGNLDDTLKNFVLEEEHTANLTFDIDRICNDIKLDSSSITATGSAGIVKIENCNHLFAKYVNVNFASSFNKFAAFLNALERSQPVIFIDKFEIIRSRDGSSNHTVDMKLAVLVGKDGETEEVGG